MKQKTMQLLKKNNSLLIYLEYQGVKKHYQCSCYTVGPLITDFLGIGPKLENYLAE